MQVNTYVTSLIRTGVPVLVGLVATFLLVHFGLHISPDNIAAVTTWLIGIITVGYYALVRLAEKRWPKLGWLLGVPAQVAYTKAKPSA